jgi:hypothetical protein
MLVEFQEERRRGRRRDCDNYDGDDDGKGEIKGKSVPVFKHHVMKTSGGVGVKLRTFLTAAVDRGEWPPSGYIRFVTEERVPGTHLMGKYS